MGDVVCPMHWTSAYADQRTSKPDLWHKVYGRMVVGNMLDFECTLYAVYMMAMATGNAAHVDKASPD